MPCHRCLSGFKLHSDRVPPFLVVQALKETPLVARGTESLPDSHILSTSCYPWSLVLLLTASRQPTESNRKCCTLMFAVCPASLPQLAAVLHPSHQIYICSCLQLTELVLLVLQARLQQRWQSCSTSPLQHSQLLQHVSSMTAACGTALAQRPTQQLQVRGSSNSEHQHPVYSPKAHPHSRLAGPTPQPDKQVSPLTWRLA